MSVYWAFEERSMFQWRKSSLQTQGPPMDAIVIHCIVKYSGFIEPNHNRLDIGGLSSRASLDSDNYSLLDYKKR